MFLRIALGFMLVAVTAGTAVATEVTQGKIMAVQSNGIVVKTNHGAEVAFVLGADAQILRDGTVAPLSALRANDAVIVTTDNKMMATILEAKSPAKNEWVRLASFALER